jgi:hypothetical protein
MSVLIPVVGSWNGNTRRINLRQGVTTFHWIDDIYAEYRNWRRTDEESRKWLPFMRAAGNEPKGGGKFTPRYVTLLDNARLVPYDENILIVATGEAITDNADIDPDPFDTSTRTQPLKLYITPPASELVKAVDELAAIEHMQFSEQVVINTVSGISGTLSPLGTQRYSVNNLADAKLIAMSRGFNTLRVKGSLTIGATESISGYKLLGDGPENTIVTLTSGCTTSKADFEEMSVSGRQSGETHYHRCDIGELSNVHCLFIDCRLVGPLTMSTTAADTSVLTNCYTGDIAGAVFIVDLNNSPCHMSFNNFYGNMKFINMNKSTAGIVSVNMGAGKVVIDSSCTTGTIKVRGTGEVIDNSNGTIVDNDVTIALLIGNILSTDQNNKLDMAASEAKLARQLQSNKAVVSEDGLTVTIYADDGITPLRTFAVTSDHKTRTPA